MFVILLNGPPASGKDTLASALGEKLLSRYPDLDGDCYKFASAIKEPIQKMFHLHDDDYEKYFETDEKNKPQDIFYGKTPRSVLISFSEDWAKPLFGKEIFGEIAGRCLTKTYSGLGMDVIIISDCGFEEELQGLFKYIDPKQCGIFRLQRDGATYKNDSRGYLENNDVLFNLPLDNNRDVSYAVQDIMKTLKEKGII